MNRAHPAGRGHAVAVFLGLVSALTLLACGGSSASSHVDAGAATEEDGAVEEAPDAADVDAWAAHGALGASCDDGLPCGSDLVCNGSFSRLPVCTQPPRSVDGVVAYYEHPDLTIAFTAPLASPDIASVQVVPLDAADGHIGEPFLGDYVATGEAEGRASLYLRCTPGAMITVSVTLIDSAGVRSEPVLVTPTEIVRVDSGALCDGLGRLCWSGECAAGPGGVSRCP